MGYLTAVFSRVPDRGVNIESQGPAASRLCVLRRVGVRSEPKPAVSQNALIRKPGAEGHG